MKWSFIVRISRPRFWFYLLGPFLIGVAAAEPAQFMIPLLLMTGIYFTFPANFLVYGINDIFDYETDKNNPKKQGYEEVVGPERQKLVSRIIWAILILTIFIMPILPFAARVGLVGFLFFGIFYSSPPIRAKTKPLLDSLFNILYIFPAFVSYGQVTEQFPPIQLIIAGTLWCMAMHAYSAVPDIESDKKAKMNTVATWLGARNTLWFCLLCYAFAAILSYSWLGLFSVVGGSVYVALMLISLSVVRTGIFEIYKRFPLINLVLGACMFFWIILL